MPSNAEISWLRLFDLLNLIGHLKDTGRLAQDVDFRLREMVKKIVETDGGFQLSKASQADLNDPAAGGLAEHAFKIVGRELVSQNPSWRPLVEVIARTHARTGSER